MTPLLQCAIDAGLQTYPSSPADAKKYELPPRMLLMLHEELVNSGLDLPAMWPGDVLALTLVGFGEIELTAATVH